jgi:hypothetical protein
MAQRPPTIAWDNVPLDAVGKLSRGPREEPEFYNACKGKILSLDGGAARMPLPEGTGPTTMKNHILPVDAARNVPVTVRRVPRNLLFWYVTDKDPHQAKDVVQRLQCIQRRQGAGSERRQRRHA